MMNTMNSRTIIIVLGILLVLAIAYIALTYSPAAVDTARTATTTSDTAAQEGGTDTAPAIGTEATYTNATSDDIRIDAPAPGAAVASSFTVSGEARGSWYFEASFPVQVLDANGTALVTVPAEAQGSWMTTDFVPFSVQVSVPGTYHGPATLVLAKDNPSGNPAMDASVLIPITVP